jgi:MarR family transcriptional regulator, 2-MHQ and catechol-resistance regulon repressor
MAARQPKVPAPASRGQDALRGELQLLKCAKRLEQLSSNRFRDQHQSSLSRFDVLANLDQAQDHVLSTSQLARLLIASQGNITRLLDRMEQDGLIQRRAHTGDRRVSEIALTTAGAAKFREMAADHQRWMTQVFGVLNDAEAGQLIRLLAKIRERVDKELQTG